MSLKYSITKSRPVEICRYSLFDSSLHFNYKGFKPYHLKGTMRPGKNYAVKERISLKEGLENYRRKVFEKNESRVRNMLLTIVAYESLNGLEPRQDGQVEIYCHNGLHNDLVLHTSDVYNVILYKNKLIFANTDDRRNNNPLFAYIGVKFETVLCNEPSPVDGSHNKLLLKGRYGRWDFKSVVEIDSYRSPEGQTLDEMTEDERYRNYCEVKLCFAPGRYLRAGLSKTRTKRDFLRLLKRNVGHFDSKTEKWLFQSYFGRQDKLVVGVRNGLFELVCNEELDVVEDLLPFVETEYPRLYEKFTRSIDTLDAAYETILRQVRAQQKSETDVFELRCCNHSVRLLEETGDAGQRRLFHKILVPEYLNWVDRGRDTLAHSRWVDRSEYLELQTQRLGHDLETKLNL